MLKRRIVAALVVKDDLVVQSIGFNKYLPIGKPVTAVEFLNDWGIDEIIYLDISATKRNSPPNFELVKSAAKHCQVPLAVGGGINDLTHIHRLMQCGADKISMNHCVLRTPQLINEAARIYGDQCIVASIDAKWTPHGYRVYDYLSRSTLEIHPADFAKNLQSLGAGEIFLNSVDRDGMKTGFDLTLIRQVSESLTVPLTVCGGAGKPQHFLQALENTTASAIAAANFFHFFEHSVTITKSVASQYFPIRHETHSRYEEHELDDSGRLLKKDDMVLERLLYLKIEKEVI